MRSEIVCSHNSASAASLSTALSPNPVGAQSERLISVAVRLSQGTSTMLQSFIASTWVGRWCQRFALLSNLLSYRVRRATKNLADPSNEAGLLLLWHYQEATFP